MDKRKAARELAKKRARELVAQMTLEEKAEQLKYDAPAIKRLGVPFYNWWNEALHGVARAGTATVFPVTLGMAASFDKNLVKEVAECIAIEGRAKYNQFQKQEDYGIYKGLTYWSPNINIFRDPRWGRGHETFGEDPYLTGTMGKAFIEGLQGDDEEYLMTAACVKHLAVHSGPEKKRHELNAEVTSKELYETYLPAFEMCVKEAQAEGAMGAYNRTNGEPCCGSFYLIRDLLRGEWGFEGYYVSDCWAIRDFHEKHFVTRTPQESAALALHAGCDINCGSTYLHMLKAYEEGLVTEEEITTSAERAFTTRFLLGLFDKTKWDSIPYTVVDSKEHKALNEKAARESIVLLKNNGLLPLNKKELHTIGVIGPNADNRVALMGNYHGTASRYITVLEGITDYVGEDVQVLYSVGSNLITNTVKRASKPDNYFSEARAVAEHSDVVVLCLGLDETVEGEESHISTGEMSGGDKVNLLLPQCQRELMEEVLSVGKPTVAILLAGGAMDLTLAQERADAVLAGWYPGARGGKALAELLFGETSPAGKLPITFYASDYELPDFEDYHMKNRTYRFVESEPLYPFGYGLTYSKVKLETALVTGFEAEALDKETEESDRIKNVRVKAVLVNTGKTDTDEVVQVYIKPLNSSLAVPNPELCAYERVHIKAGESIEVTLGIPAKSFTCVNAEGKRVLDSRRFKIIVSTCGGTRRGEVLSDTQNIEIIL